MCRKLIISALLVLGMGFSGCSGLQEVKAPGYGDPPIITASFCVDQGMYGDPMKIHYSMALVTLVMGLIANVFASYFVSKFLFEWVLGKRQVQTLSI